MEKQVNPIQFPDRFAKMREEGDAFQALSSDEKWRRIGQLVEAGRLIAECSSHREAIAAERERKRSAKRLFYRELMAKYGSPSPQP